jgi:hypothetical protein
MVAGVGYAVRVDNKTFVNANGQVYKGIQNNTALNFTVTAVAAPVIANLHGDSVSYVEDSAYVLLDSASNATVSDADSSNYSGGKLTVQVSANRVDGQDVLFIRNQGNGVNQISVSGNSITYNGLQIGTFTGGSNGNPLVVTFTNNANATTAAALVQNLAYRNSNTVDPTTTPRTVSISMDDGAGGTSAVSEVTLNVLPVNDAPVVNITATNPTYTENAPGGAAVQWRVDQHHRVRPESQPDDLHRQRRGQRCGREAAIDGGDVMLINGTSVVTSNNSTEVTVSVTSGTASVTSAAAQAWTWRRRRPSSTPWPIAMTAKAPPPVAAG